MQPQIQDEMRLNLTLNEYVTMHLEQDGFLATTEAVRQYSHRHLSAEGILPALDRAVQYLHRRRKELLLKEARLLALEPICAGTHYRPDANGQPKYLYLIHPTDATGNRKREYIGADPDKQAAALARLQAYNDLLQVQKQMEQIDHRLRDITRSLADALRCAVYGR